MLNVYAFHKDNSSSLPAIDKFHLKVLFEYIKEMQPPLVHPSLRSWVTRFNVYSKIENVAWAYLTVAAHIKYNKEIFKHTIKRTT